jgi:hypothetical protein
VTNAHKIRGKEGSLVVYDEIQGQQEFELSDEPVIPLLPASRPASFSYGAGSSTLA